MKAVVSCQWSVIEKHKITTAQKDHSGLNEDNSLFATTTDY